MNSILCSLSFVQNFTICIRILKYSKLYKPGMTVWTIPRSVQNLIVCIKKSGFICIAQGGVRLYTFFYGHHTTRAFKITLRNQYHEVVIILYKCAYALLIEDSLKSIFPIGQSPCRAYGFLTFRQSSTYQIIGRH